MFIALIVIITLVLSSVQLLRVNAIQHKLANGIIQYAQDSLGLPIKISNISTKSFNKLEADSILLSDLNGDTLIAAEKIILHFSIFNLFKDEIKINNLTIGHPTIRIKRQTATSPTNAQFLFDLLSSNDTTRSSTLPRIKINQLHTYEGAFSYDILSQPQTNNNEFDSNHIGISDFRATISLKTLTTDSLNFHLRHLSGKERSGMCIIDATTLLKAAKGKCNIEKFRIKVPDGEIALSGTTYATYQLNEKTKIPQDLYIKGNLLSKRFDLRCISMILPSLKEVTTPLKFNIPFLYSNGKISTQSATVATYNNSISAKLHFAYDTKASTFNASIDEGNITNEGINTISSIAKLNIPTESINSIEYISFNGNAKYAKNELESTLNIESNAGDIYSVIKPNATGGHHCSISCNNIDLRNILSNNDLGKANANISISFNGIKNSVPQGEISSHITNFTYKNYKYSPIRVTARATSKKITLQTQIDDRNLKSNAELTINTGKRTPSLLLKLDVDTICPYNLALTNHDTQSALSFSLDGRVNGKTANIDIDNIGCTANIKNLILNTPNKKRKVDNINIVYDALGERKNLTVVSNIINCHLNGNYSFATIHNSFLALLQRHTPSLIQEKLPLCNNNFIFGLKLKDSEIFEKFIKLPISISEPSEITVNCVDESQYVTINGNLNGIKILNNSFNNIILSAEHRLNGIHLAASAKSINTTDNTQNLEIKYECLAHNDTLNNVFDFRVPNVNSGRLRIDAAFGLDKNNELVTSVHIPSSTILYKGNQWQIADTYINSKDKNFDINNLILTKDNRRIAVNGTIGSEVDDTLQIELKDIILEEVMDIVNFHSVSFAGIATGSATLRSLLSSPQFDSALKVDSFKFENGYMGELSLIGDWQEEEKAVRLKGIINDKDYCSEIQGIVSPANDSINLEISADGTRIGFLNHLISSIVSDVELRVYGDIAVRGKLSSVNLYGDLKTNGSLKIKSTNTTYNIYGEDTLHFTRNKIGFDNFKIYDHRNNRGTINGSIDHQSLKKFKCSFDIEANNMQAYDTQTFNDDGFYGTAYITGNAKIRAGSEGFRLNADVAAERGSKFVYNSAGPLGATNNSFVTFVDRNAKKSHNNSDKDSDTKKGESSSNLHLEFKIAVDPEIQLRVYTNTATNDYIDIYSSGTIDVIHDDKEDFKMAGNLEITRGTYKFTIQPIFSKEFNLRSGSIKFNGKPFDAILDINAVHTVSSARLSDLDLTADKRNNVKVDCLMNITGTLQEPILSFDLELPDGNEEQREFLSSATSTPEQTNMQFMYLVAIGKFYTYDYNNMSSENQSSTMMESLISSAISGQVNNMLSQMTDNENIDISGNFITNEKGWNSMEVGGMITYRLLNNRLVINGNLSYRDNPYNNRNFTGDFDIRYIFDKRGIFSIKGYSKTNDRYFSRTDLITRGIGLMIHHNFNKWFSLKKKKRKEKNKTQ